MARARLSVTGAAGTIQNLKLAFPKKYSQNPKKRFSQTIQILDQLHKQIHGHIPASARKPIAETSQELKMISLSSGRLTQKGNISVVHADKNAFGKRYTLQVDKSSISLAVAGSNKLYDLFIDINQDGNILLSYKGMASLRRKKMIQLAVMPSDLGSGSSNYMYSISFDKTDFKKTGLSKASLLQQLRKLSLTPELYMAGGKDGKITAEEFEEMFGVKKLSQTHVNASVRNISSSYRKLHPHIGGQLEYEAGIKGGSLRDVSQKSLLGAILAQSKKKRLPKVVIVKINDLVGYGLIAGQRIPAGAIIGEYCGKISKAVVSAAAADKDNTYFAAYAPDEVPGSEMFVIDAKKSGNSTRFINHSDENANAAWAHIFDGAKFRLIIAATKPILTGKQILLRYKRSYWSGRHLPDPCPL